MKIILDPNVAEWVMRKIPHMHGRGFGPFVAIGVINEDADLLGGVVFHNYQEPYRSIEWSAASGDANWLSRRIINTIMDYPFRQMGCVRLTAVIPRKNVRAREFHHTFGFKQEGQVRRGYGNDDAIIYGLLAGEWRRSPLNLKRESNGQEGARPAQAG